MENQEKKITLDEALRIIINNLGSVSFPSSVIAVMSSDQIMAVKKMVIDPVEQARRNLIDIYMAFEKSRQEEEANEQQEDNAIELVPVEEESV